MLKYGAKKSLTYYYHPGSIYKNIETPKDLGNVRARIISGCRKNRKIEIEFKKFWGFWHPLRLRSNNDMHTYSDYYR